MLLHTITQIADLAGYRSHQIRRVVKTRGIQPTVRFGDQGAQLFGPKSVELILANLDAITARRIPLQPLMGIHS